MQDPGSGTQPASSGGVWRTVGLGLVGLSPFAVLGSVFTPVVREYPLWVTGVVVVLMWPVGFVMRVANELVNRWVPKATDRAERAFGRHRKGYLARLHEHVRHLEVLGVATQGEFTLKLGDVYVDVSVAPQSSAGGAREPLVGHGRTAAASAVSSGRQTLAEAIAASESGVLAVIGGPGSGKTTLLRHQALVLSQPGRRRGDLPILLEIRQHTAEIVAERTTVARLASSLPWQAEKTPAEWIAARLDRGECLVMLDGLDEVADETERRRVVAWVRGQISRYPKNRFVITSRAYGYDDNPLSNADRLQVRRFTGKQIGRFLHAWYEAVERRSTGEAGAATAARAAAKADELIEKIHGLPALYELAANPLLLTMIALVHRYRGALPGSRAALYEEMVAVLLHRRREAKGLGGGAAELTGAQRESVARHLARHMMEQEVRDLPLTEAKRVVSSRLRRMAAATISDEYLREAVQSGLLIEPKEGSVAFVHLTLQEYLAAAEIREQGDEEALYDVVGRSWWRETVLLWASGSDVTGLVRACMAVGTNAAAILADGCIREGREADREVLEEFERFLARRAKAGVNDPFTAITVAKWTRNAIPLESGPTITQWPAQQRHVEMCITRGSADDIFIGESSVAVGVPGGIAAALPSWISELLEDGHEYRLPTAEEMDDPAVARVRDIGGRNVWVQGERGPALWVPEGARPSFRLTREELKAKVRTDSPAIGSTMSGEMRERLWAAGSVDDFPEEIVPSLQGVIRADARVAGAESPGAWGAGGEGLVAAVDEIAKMALRELASPTTEGESRESPARIAIISRLAIINTVPHSAVGLRLVDGLIRVYRSLVVHEYRSNGTIPPNEVLLLVRD